MRARPLSGGFISAFHIACSGHCKTCPPLSWGAPLWSAIDRRDQSRPGLVFRFHTMRGFSSEDTRYQSIWKRNTCFPSATLPPLITIAGVASTPKLPRPRCFPGGRVCSFALVCVTRAPQCSSLPKQTLSRPGLHALTPALRKLPPAGVPGPALTQKVPARPHGQ